MHKVSGTIYTLYVLFICDVQNYRTMKLESTKLPSGWAQQWRAWSMRKLAVLASRGYSSTSQGKTKQVYQATHPLLRNLSFLLQEYELRRYSPAKWVSYTVKCMKKKEAQSDGFWKLFNYIQGENETGDPFSC